MSGKVVAFRAISFLWLGSIIGAGCAFLTQVILARDLGPTAFGVFAAALSTVTLLAPLAGFGIAQYWLKVFGYEGWQAMRWLPGSFRFIGLSTTAVFLLLLVWGQLAPHDALSAGILFILSFHVLGQLSIELVSAKLQLEERYLNLALWQVLPHLGRLVLIVVLAYAATNMIDAQYAAYTYAIVASVFFVSAIWLLSRMYGGIFDLKGHRAIRKTTLSYRSDDPGMFQVAAQSWPFGVAGLFYLIYFQSDIILLRYMNGAESAGIYNVAFTVMGAVYLLPSVVYQKFLLPKMQRWAHHDREKFYQVYRQGNIVMLAFGFTALLVLYLLAPIALPRIFSEEYRNAVTFVQILAIAAPFRFLASSAGAVLMTRNYMRLKIRLMGVAAIFNVVFNFIMIPLYGAVGAAVATVATEVLLLTLMFFAVKKNINSLFL